MAPPTVGGASLPEHPMLVKILVLLVVLVLGVLACIRVRRVRMVPGPPDVGGAP